jgi:hydroxymethylglutaryl-CoA lyase
MGEKPHDVVVKEVGLRDGLQIIEPIMATADKRHWCERAAEAGIVEIEVTSLVPARLIPQFFDAETMIEHAKLLPGVTASALIPNLKGAERGMALGLQKLMYVVSVSESFNHANVRRSRQESIEDLQRIMALRARLPVTDRPAIVAGVSSAFGCGLEGRIPVDEVVRVVELLLDAGVDEVVLADTTGSGDPAWVKAVVRPVIETAREIPVAAHFHDTRGLGLANVLAALDCGVRRFEASLGGLGGCPNSPGATGNVATEDLVYMLEAMGLNTGVDLVALIELRRDIAARLPGTPFHGRLAGAGPPKGFQDFHKGASARPEHEVA